MDNIEVKSNELDQPTELNPIPANTAEIMDPLTGFNPEQTRQKEYVKKELVRLEQEVWQHEDTADYTEATAIPPVDQLIEKNIIAIDRHREIVEELKDSTKREDRERRKASEADIKLLEKDNIGRAEFKMKLQQVIDSRRNQANEVKLHMKFLAEKYGHLFRPEPEPEVE